MRKQWKESRIMFCSKINLKNPKSFILSKLYFYRSLFFTNLSCLRAQITNSKNWWNLSLSDVSKADETCIWLWTPVRKVSYLCTTNLSWLSSYETLIIRIEPWQITGEKASLTTLSWLGRWALFRYWLIGAIKRSQARKTWGNSHRIEAECHI